MFKILQKLEKLTWIQQENEQTLNLIDELPNQPSNSTDYYARIVTCAKSTTQFTFSYKSVCVYCPLGWKTHPYAISKYDNPHSMWVNLIVLLRVFWFQLMTGQLMLRLLATVSVWKQLPNNFLQGSSWTTLYQYCACLHLLECILNTETNYD